MSRSNPSPTTVAAIFAKPKPADTRLRVPCTELVSTCARLEEQGRHVLAMEVVRKKTNGERTYLLTVQ